MVDLGLGFVIICLIYVIDFQTGPGFGGGGFRRPRQQPQQEEPVTIGSAILQFLPIILLVMISFISMFSIEDDPFSFQRTYDYSMAKTTQKHNVQFYVNPRSFPKRFNTVRKQAELESRVEADVRIRKF